LARFRNGDWGSSVKLEAYAVYPWYCADFRHLDQRRNLAKVTDLPSVPHGAEIKLPLLFVVWALIFTIIGIGRCGSEFSICASRLNVPHPPSPFIFNPLSLHNKGKITLERVRKTIELQLNIRRGAVP
jgi:hypothetical protein